MKPNDIELTVPLSNNIIQFFKKFNASSHDTRVKIQKLVNDADASYRLNGLTLHGEIRFLAKSIKFSLAERKLVDVLIKSGVAKDFATAIFKNHERRIEIKKKTDKHKKEFAAYAKRKGFENFEQTKEEHARWEKRIWHSGFLEYTIYCVFKQLHIDTSNVVLATCIYNKQHQPASEVKLYEFDDTVKLIEFLENKSEKI